MVLAGKDMKMYAANPEAYSLNSYNNLKAGRICAIIGLILSIIGLLCGIVYVAFLGTFLSSNPDFLKSISK